MAIKKQLRRSCVMAGTWLLLAHASAFAQELPPGNVSVVPVAPPVVSHETIQFLGSETAEVDQNPLMLTSGARTLIGSVTAPELIYDDTTPLSELRLDSLVDENLYNQSEFSSTDLHEKGSISAHNERWMAALNGNVDYDTTRTSEPSAFDISTIPIRHFGVNVTPQMAFSPDATDKWTMQGTVITSTYRSNFQNYEIGSLNPTYAHNFDPQNTGLFTIEAQEYRTTSGLQNSNDSIGPQIGWTTQFTPQIVGKASIGAQEQRQFQEGAASQAWTLTYVYSADLTFKGEQDTFDLSSSRNETPFGNGTEALLTSVGFTEQHSINDRLALNIGGSYEMGTYQIDTAGSLQSYWSGSAGLTYHALQNVDAVVNYEYRYETLTNTSGNATDNLLTLGLVYHPMAWPL